MGLWDELTTGDGLAREIWMWDGTEFRCATWEGLVARSRQVASGLRKRGVEPGSIVPAILSNGPDVGPGYMGIWFAGATIASLPIIARGMSLSSYTDQLARLCGLLGTDFILVEERFMKFMPDKTELGVDLVGYRSLTETSDAAPVDPPSLDGTVFIQFSSGTTGEPRGVELSGRAIETQMKMLMNRFEIDPKRDIGYMWLPKSHDMGFFGGALLAWYAGMRGFQSTPERFLESPRTWFDDCARVGATITAGPPFAVDMAVRAERVRGGSGALAIRICLVGAELVDWEILEDAAKVFGPRGLDLGLFTSAYGLAEATLGVTIGDLASPPRFLDIEVDALLDGRVKEVAQDASARRRLVSAGTPLGDTVVRCEGTIGEIVVRSPSVASGYVGSTRDGNGRLENGELWTGDIGFIHDGQLYVSGRSDDLLIIGGRNVHARDIEAGLSREQEIRKGNCALVTTSESGGARIGLVAELTDDECDPGELAARLRRLSMQSAGVPITDFVFLPTNTFPKTPSGKPQRYRCRQILSESDLGIRVVLRRQRSRT
jgi:acyl-CoA synthetase (AMP-forming)/AMP-acid ligase II